MDEPLNYLVSYRLHSDVCGNQTFPTLEEAIRFTEVNAPLWKSYTVFSYTPGVAIATLTPAI